MAFQIEVKIEPSSTGKTLGIAFHKAGAEKPFAVVKGCRIASGSNGEFVSGPSTKMDDGKWFSYLFMDKDFGAYVTRMALEASPKPSKGGAPVDEDIPFNRINSKLSMVI